METKPKRGRGRPRKYTDDGHLIETDVPNDDVKKETKYQRHRDYYRAYQAAYRKRNMARIVEITRAHDKRKELAKKLNPELGSDT